MTPLSKRVIFWAPRALSILFIVFLSLFALDVFGEGLGVWQTLGALALHLVPVFVLIIILVLAWRWEWIGAALYTAAGLLYVAWVHTRPIAPSLRVTWILTIAGPAFLIAALFLVNWRKRSEIRAGR